MYISSQINSRDCKNNGCHASSLSAMHSNSTLYENSAWKLRWEEREVKDLRNLSASGYRQRIGDRFITRFSQRRVLMSAPLRASASRTIHYPVYSHSWLCSIRLQLFLTFYGHRTWPRSFGIVSIISSWQITSTYTLSKQTNF